MDIKDSTYMLSTDEYIKLLAACFENGLALDSVDVDGLSSGDITDNERYMFDAAEGALDRIDMDELLSKAEELNIPDKYPRFYDYMLSLQKEHDGHEDRVPTASDFSSEDSDDINQETPEQDSNEFTMGEQVSKNLVEGEHTGKKRDIEAYRKGDEYREKLNEEYRQKMQSADGNGFENKLNKKSDQTHITGIEDKATNITKGMHDGDKNANDVSHVVKGKQYTSKDIEKAGLDNETVSSIHKTESKENIDSKNANKALKQIMGGAETATTVASSKEEIAKAAAEPHIIASAVNRTQGKNSISGKQIADSYSMAGQIDAETARISAEMPAGEWQKRNSQPDFTPCDIGGNDSFGFQGTPIQSVSTKNVAEIGVVCQKRGNLITMEVNGRPKQFTIRSGGTINVEGTIMNVYDDGDNRRDKVFVGWKNANIAGDKVSVPGGGTFNLATDGVTVQNASGLSLKVTKVGAGQSAKNTAGTTIAGVTSGAAVSYSSVMKGTTIRGKDFSATANGTFTTNNFAANHNVKPVDSLLKNQQMPKTIHKQRRMACAVMHNQQMARISNAMQGISASSVHVNAITSNYNKILTINSKNAKQFAAMNDYLEKKYLSKEQIKELSEKRLNLKNLRLSQNADIIREQISKGKLSLEELKAATEYLNVYNATREQVVRKGILSGNTGRGTTIERAFFASSMPFILSEEGLPVDAKGIKKALRKGGLTAEQEAILKNTLTLKRSIKMRARAMETLKGLVKASKNTMHKIKNFANRYMGNDYTMRGLLMLTGVAGVITSAPVKAYHTAKRAKALASNIKALAKTTARTTAAVGKTGVRAVRGGARTVRFIYKNGTKKSVKEASKRIKGFVSKRHGILKNMANLTKKAGITIIRAIVRILTLILTTLLSILGPVLFIVVMLIALVLAILAFINGTGDEIYYDAGDEDTTLAMQEMVDVLTLCHASFRSAISTGTNAGASASQAKWISTLEEWADTMVKAEAIYSNSGNKTYYADALRQTPVKTNCALLVTHALQKAGFFDKTDKFYGHYDGTLRGSGVNKLKQVATVTYYKPGSTQVKDIQLEPGDILTYHEGHTNVYIGTKDGKKQWIDAGRGTTINCCTGSKWKSFHTTGNMSGYHISYHIRLNFSASESGSSIADNVSGGTKQMKKGDTSKVEGLYDVTQGTWWNYEFTYQYIHGRWAAGTKQKQLDDMFTNGKLSISGNGNYAFVNNKMYMAAFGSYWGETGDVLKVTFNKEIKIGNQPATKVLYIIKCDAKAWVHTGYPAEPEGIYGHHLGGHRDFAEFMGYGSQPAGLNGQGIVPVSCTNMGSILDGSVSLDDAGGMSSVIDSDSEIFYRQEINQDFYKSIINTDKNIYYTNPEEQKPPEGITPTPTPKGYDKKKPGLHYGFYNNNQELISMVLAMYDFDINDITSAKETIITTKDVSGKDDASADSAAYKGVTDKIGDNEWKLISLFKSNNLDFTKYKEGSFDDLRYSTLVGLFNASHIITDTTVKEYHRGPDGTYNPVKDKKTGRVIGQNNKDGRSYEVPVMETVITSYQKEDGTYASVSETRVKTDENGDIVYETLYAPCPGHIKHSVAVITLHFDSLLNLKDWWKKNIYSVDNFKKENPDYESVNPKDDNYNMKSTELKRTLQYIKKPDYYKGLNGTCDSDTSSTSDSSFNPGTLNKSQQEVAKTAYKFMISQMGLNRAQALGILANIKRECGFNYTAVENGGGGYGLIQWTGGRRTALVNWCNAHPSSGAYNTLEGQLAYLKVEMTMPDVAWTGTNPWTDGGVSYSEFKSLTDSVKAGQYFLYGSEQPGEPYRTQRYNEMASDVATVEQYIK